jgi:two-component system copper resistance phosphate regulon response regulator CusR
MKVLIVEDSDRLREALRVGLAATGLAVDVASDGLAALPYLDGCDYDVLVLDLMMPRLDGRALLAEVRRRRLTSRILVLSALDAVGERVEAIDAGADDYLVKPFSFDELRARVLALGRRHPGQPAAVFEHQGVTLDTSRRTASGPLGPLSLTPKEYALLETLVQHPGRVYSRPQLFERLYASDSEASDKVIEVLMSTLRAKLSRGGLEDLIETRRGLGYAAR